MKLAELREEYYTQTGKASEVVRQITYAGLATIWVFKTGEPVAAVPKSLIPSAALFAGALLFDLLQYVTASRAWMNAVFGAERQGKRPSHDFPVPASIHRWPLQCFRLKSYCALGGVVWLIGGLGWMWLTQPSSVPDTKQDLYRLVTSPKPDNRRALVAGSPLECYGSSHLGAQPKERQAVATSNPGNTLTWRNP